MKIPSRGTHVTNPWSNLGVYEREWPFKDSFFLDLGSIDYSIGLKEEGFNEGDGYTNDKHESFKARDAFLCAGILMSPSGGKGGARAWGFFLEHIESLRPASGRLRIKHECKDWEERVRTIFIERFALGLAGLVLWKKYEVLHIADAGPFIEKELRDPTSPYNRKKLISKKLYGKNGGFKPDLFCLTSDGECVIAESKGAIGPPGRLKSPKKKGREQVENVEPVGVNVRVNGGALVVATNLRYESDNPNVDKDSCTFVVDPEIDEEAVRVKVTGNEIVLLSYCKLLGLFGFREIVRQLLSYEPIKINTRERVIGVDRYKIFPLMKSAGHVIGIESEVIEILFKNDKHLAEDINESLARREMKYHSDDKTLILPNGFIYSTKFTEFSGY